MNVVNTLAGPITVEAKTEPAIHCVNWSGGLRGISNQSQRPPPGYAGRYLCEIMNNNPELTPEAREAISKHVWRLVIPSGIGLTVASFLLGFFVNEVAKSNAYTDALDDYSSHIITAAKEVGAAKGRAETAATEAELLTQKITTLNERMTKLSKDNQLTREEIDFARKQLDNTEREVELFQNELRTAIVNTQERVRQLESKIQQFEQMIEDLHRADDAEGDRANGNETKDQADPFESGDNGDPFGGDK